MNVHERLVIYCHNLTQETPFCINCKHFYQHYRKDGWPFNSGHCCFPRLKLRRDYDTCEHFENKHDPGREGGIA